MIILLYKILLMCVIWNVISETIYIIIITITTCDVYCVTGKELNNNIMCYVTDGEHISFFAN